MIVKVKEAIEISTKLKKQGKSIVLAGGCFDILHVGHIRFLKAARESGDFLFVLLENDRSVKKLKGDKRPINSQKDRAEVLSELSSINYIVLLPDMNSDKSYDKLINQILPAVIATTKNDSGLKHKIRQSKLTNAKLKTVASRFKNYSTTKLILEK